MKIHEVKQGSPEWLTLRLGKVTASEIDALVSPLGKIRTGKGPETYLYTKLCERLLGYSPAADVNTFAMGQGAIMESEARPWYEFTREVAVQQVGFITDDSERFGCSPDGLIGTDGGIEIKCPQPARALEYLLTGEVPDEYTMQIQFSMFVTGRAWWDFLSYSRQFPALVVRVPRDEKIQATLTQAVEIFAEKFDAALARITALRSEDNPADAARKAAHERQVAAWAAQQEGQI